MDLYVGNIPYSTTELELRELFSEYGEVGKVKVIIDHITNRSKGFAFVEMPKEEEAKKAMTELNQQELEGRKLYISEARPLGERRQRSFNRDQRRERSFGYGRNDSNENGWYQKTRMGRFDTRRSEPDENFWNR